MKVQYDHGDAAGEIELSDDEIGFLKAYALAVLRKMQVSDSEYADCWTSCTISFMDLAPEFHWSSIDDAIDSHPIQVQLPVPPR